MTTSYMTTANQHGIRVFLAAGDITYHVDAPSSRFVDEAYNHLVRVASRGLVLK